MVLKNKVDFLCIQESMLGDGSIFYYASVWGNGGFDSETVGARGKSGGLVCLWNPIKFSKIHIVKDNNYIVISGTLVEDGSLINIVNVYAPQKVCEKRNLWERLLSVMLGKSGMWMLSGDFNAVRWVEERRNLKFNSRAAEIL